MSEPFALDDPPTADADEQDTVDGKIQCPECDKSFKPSGLQRHITMIHRGGVGATSSGTNKPSKSIALIETRWADFQRGVALLVSLACTQCAQALSEDANTDAIALAQFCSHRPKLKKQLEDFLTTADFILLVGAFGGTAQKMLSHHSIGRKIPGLVPVENTDHASHDPSARMIEFMQAMPEEQRNQIFNRAMEARAQQVAQTEQFVVQQQEPLAREDAPGAEPQPGDATLTEHDRAIREAMTNGASEFMETVPIG